MTLGSGRDLLVFEGNSADIIVTDFEAGRDLLQFHDPEAMIAAAVDVEGGVELHALNGGTLTILGHDAADVSRDWFV